jgi:conjugal transfer pilus assembly protein TraF
MRMRNPSPSTAAKGARWQAARRAAVLTVAVLSVGASWAQGAPRQQAASVLADAEDAEPVSYFRRQREGWFWYIDPAPPPKPLEPKPEAAAPAAPSPQERDLAAFKEFQLRFEAALNAATQNPSESNVVRFLELYAQARRKAAVFSDTAEALAVRMPWIDETFSGGRPTGPGAMRAFDTIRMQDRDQTIRDMAQSYGLYFFFRSNCAYCHVQAPLLKQFEAKYGFTIFAVSLDGGMLPDFPNAMRDNGLAAAVADAIGVPMQHFVTPAIVLARPSTREVVPVGFGALNMDEIVDRIAMAVRIRDSGAGQAPPSQLAALTGEAAPRRAVSAPTPAARLLRLSPATR